MLQTLVENYGYPIILIGTVFEGETILILGGLVAKLGYLELHWVMVSAFIGALLGDQVCFFIGRYHGKALLAKHPTWQRRVNWVQRYLERHQTLLILSFRFIYGIRSITPFVIGMSRVKTARFIVLHILATALWVVVVGTAGYFFGRTIELLLGDLKQFELFVLGAIVIVGVVTWLYRRRKLRQSQLRALPKASAPDGPIL